MTDVKGKDEIVVVRLMPQKQSDGSIVFSWNERGTTRTGLLAFGCRGHREAQRVLATWKPTEKRISAGLAPPRAKLPVTGKGGPTSAALDAPTLKLTRMQAENACTTYDRRVKTQKPRP
jgi:hypothetical protein